MFFLSLCAEEFFRAGVGFLILQCRRNYYYFFLCGEVRDLVSIGTCFVCCVVFVVVVAAAVVGGVVFFWGFGLRE
jgi:hypothetical protein